MGLVLNVFLGILLSLDFKLGGSKNQVQARPFRPRDASRVFHSLRPYRPGPPARNLEERPRYQPNEDKAWVRWRLTFDKISLFSDRKSNLLIKSY